MVNLVDFDMKINIKFLRIIILSFVLILIYIFSKRLKKEESEIKLNNFTTVAKIFEINSKRSFTEAKYFYFFEGLKYQSREHIDLSGNQLNNKFYEIKLSKINPTIVRININKEIKNTRQILESGFEESDL